MPRRDRDRLEPALELGGGVEGAADVDVDVGAVGAEALLAQHPRHQGQRAVAGQEARAPGSPGRRVRARRRAGVRRPPPRAPTLQGADARSGPPRRPRCASRSIAADPRGGEALRGQPGRQRRCCHTVQGYPEVTVRYVECLDGRHRWRSSGMDRLPGLARDRRRGLRASCSPRSAPGVELCYQTFGDPDDEPLLLVMGLGGPMTWWDPDLCRMLAERGFYVIRYDNRDTGRSTEVAGPGDPRPCWSGRSPARRVRAPYSPRATWPPTPSACSTTSASSRPTSPACRWAG